MMVDGIVERAQGTGPEYAFYGLKHRAELAGEPAIFLATNGISGRWTEKAHEPIAYMSTTGMSDNTCPWDAGDNIRGAKYALLEKAEDNGCDIPDDIPTTSPGSRTHLCYEFEGCMEGYPVVICNAPHTKQNADFHTHPARKRKNTRSRSSNFRVILLNL